MNLRNLEKLFLDGISVEEIRNEIDVEVEAFRTARSKGGASSPIYGSNEDFTFIVRKKDVKKLCDLYLKGNLNEWHLEYIFNLIELSEAFSMESIEVEEAIFVLSSPEINGSITAEKVESLCESL